MSSPTEPMIPRLFRVDAIHKDTSDTFSLELQPVDRGVRFSFKPGQFNMVYLYGVGEIPISISSNPTNEFTFTHTTRKVGTVTTAMGQLKKNDVVGIRGPFGTSWPIEQYEGQDIVLVTGGIGLAPIRPAIYHILENRKRYQRVVLLYGAREPGDILFGKELKAWSKQGIDVFVTVDRAAGKWSGSVGVVTRLIPRAPFHPHNTAAMICGPEVMMFYTVEALKTRGVPASRIHVSMERNMKCAIGFCGHCQYGPEFICKDGPVFAFDQIKWIFNKAEV